jgi:galactokinase/mevalonate kinase-like predicted kinase
MGKQSNTIAKSMLPDNILIYYSGHNKTVADIVEKYEKSFRKRIRKASTGESRRFIGIGADIKNFYSQSY